MSDKHPPSLPLSRRAFLGTATMGTLAGLTVRHGAVAASSSYDGPRIIVVRFGGGVRRRETIDPDHTHSPYFLRKLVPRGVFFPRMEISQFEGIETSHGQGTLYILTGRYDRYVDVRGRPLGQRFEAKVPTLFEQLRATFDVPEHEALIINGEDRTDEEFYSFSNHHLFGVQYRSSVLSLYRFKTHLLRRQLEEPRLAEDVRLELARKLEQLEAIDHRAGGAPSSSPALEGFWDRWRGHYGDSGFVNPRGDRLLTELALRALDELRPKLLLINYNDPDYVHWGNPSHYTRGIAVIDEGLERLVDAVETDPEYRDNTIFVIVPDCGRDDNRLVRVPFQHHFGSRASHEIFALVFGAGIPSGRVVDRKVDQIQLAATVSRLMGMPHDHAEGEPLGEVFG